MPRSLYVRARALCNCHLRSMLQWIFSLQIDIEKVHYIPARYPTCNPRSHRLHISSTFSFSFFTVGCRKKQIMCMSMCVYLCIARIGCDNGDEKCERQEMNILCVRSWVCSRYKWVEMKKKKTKKRCNSVKWTEYILLLLFIDCTSVSGAFANFTYTHLNYTFWRFDTIK